jgi:putative transposase
MSHRYRLTPTPEQEATLRGHCAHARFVWNLAVEQQLWWRWGRANPPTFAAQTRQLTEARAESEWLRAGSTMVQQGALRDFAQAMIYFFRGTHGKPTWRKAGRNEGFGVSGYRGSDRRSKWDVRRVSRHVGEVRIPHVGWVRFRWSRAVPDAKTYRVTLDRSGRWHVTFTAIPEPLSGPGTGEVVGIDRGVIVSAALSTGEMLHRPGLRDTERARLLRLQRKFARARRGSNRRSQTRLTLARLMAREVDRRRDWAEKVSTDLARRFDVIRVEDLKIRNMVRSAKGTVEKPGKNVRAKTARNRAIRTQGWGFLVRRLEEKARGRVEKVPPPYTSMTCNACGHCAPENRKSQAVFRCAACGHEDHADTNAAKNIARGHRVNARGGDRVTGPVNREPQRAA